MQTDDAFSWLGSGAFRLSRASFIPAGAAIGVSGEILGVTFEILFVTFEIYWPIGERILLTVESILINGKPFFSG